MSDTQGASGEPEHRTVINPASPSTINMMGACYLAFATLLFYLLITAWPVQVLDDKKVVIGFKEFNIFGIICYWAADRQILFIVAVAGAIGAIGHALTSFGDYVGNRQLSTDWIWFFILRAPIGVALAILFYFIVRGGLLLPTTQSQVPSTAYDTTLGLNPYGIAAFAALAGMFSKQATDKLGEVFSSVFAMKKPVERGGALGSGQPLKFTPAKLTFGKTETLTIDGAGFHKGCTVTVGGRSAPVKSFSDTRLTVDIVALDVDKAGRLEIVITNPAPDNLVFKGSIEVGKLISGTSPQELTKEKVEPLTINGQGLKDCTVTVSGTVRTPTSADDKKIVIALTAQDVATAPAELKIVVKSPDPNGVTDEIVVKVKSP